MLKYIKMLSVHFTCTYYTEFDSLVPLVQKKEEKLVFREFVHLEGSSWAWVVEEHLEQPFQPQNGVLSFHLMAPRSLKAQVKP